MLKEINRMTNKKRVLYFLRCDFKGCESEAVFDCSNILYDIYRAVIENLNFLDFQYLIPRLDQNSGLKINFHGSN